MALEIPENSVSLCVQVIETVVCTPSTEHPYSTGDNRSFPENRDISDSNYTVCASVTIFILVKFLLKPVYESADMGYYCSLSFCSTIPLFTFS